MRLYSRYRNSAGERVRIAMNLKGLDYEYVPVADLPKGEYRRINPQGLMPTLEVDGAFIAQYSAILDYLEERFPEPSLLPADPLDRARARAFGAHISSEMHPLTVTRVRNYVTGALGADEDALQAGLLIGCIMASERLKAHWRRVLSPHRSVSARRRAGLNCIWSPNSTMSGVSASTLRPTRS